MTEARMFSRWVRNAVVVGASLLPLQASGQEVDFDRLWSHDTGG